MSYLIENFTFFFGFNSKIFLYYDTQISLNNKKKGSHTFSAQFREKNLIYKREDFIALLQYILLIVRHNFYRFSSGSL